MIKNKIYFREDIIYEDELFTPIAFMCAEQVQKIDKCFYNYRNREGSIMNSFGNDHFQSKFKIYYSLMFDKKNSSKILIKKYFWLYQTYFSRANILYLKEHLKLLFLSNLTLQDRIWLIKVLRYVKEIKWSIEKEI